MVKNIILTICLFFLCINSSFAKIDVVYPTSKEFTVNADSVFFIGNTDKNSSFFINSNPVKLWDDNFFVYVVPLEYGKNEIKLYSKLPEKEEEITYIITRNKPSGKTKPNNNSVKKFDNALYTKTIKDNAAVRSKPSNSSQRITHLPENVILYLYAQSGDWYKTDENEELWIHKSNIEPPKQCIKKTNPELEKIKFSSDKKYDYAKFRLTYPVMFKTEQTGNSVNFTLYGIQPPNNTYTFSKEKITAGYDCHYENNTLIFRMAKIPAKTDKNKPLKNIVIFVDAGHGGDEKGATGPTRVYEKDINLYIAKYLAEYLEDSGAKVILSRQDDTKTGLYDRVKIAKDNDAFISLSIHNNSLPDGKNPYITHGCEVYYYNENAKLLSEIINNNLSNDLKLKNGGIHKTSFALNRSTNPVSVVIEIAYMINPEEYILLQNDDFQRKAAQSIKNSIEKYIFMIKNSKI